MADAWLSSIARFVAAAALTVIIVRLLGPVAHRFGWLDRPRGRKNHPAATPFTGGLAMLLSVLLTATILPLASETLLAFGIGSTVLLVVGALDDLYDLPWSVSLSAQLGVALLMVHVGGLRIEFIGPSTDPASIALGPLAAPFSVLITIGMINAMNMVDGIDGAAGCLGLASLMLLAIVCVLINNGAVRDRVALFTGVTAGFLIMNLRHRWQARAQVFLGNSGSAIVGFGLAWLVSRVSQTTTASYSTLFAPWFLALPVIDAIVVVLHRLRRGKSPFHGDHDHLHHLMLEAGYSPTRAALVMSAVSLLLGLSVLLAVSFGLPPALQILLFIGLVGLHYKWTAERARAVGLLRRGCGNRNAHAAEASAVRHSD